jgi:mannose-6-phosphate isomerase-like protein (cupin superfamily)
MSAYVVHEREVDAVTADGSTRVRRTIGPDQGCARLRQEVVRFGSGTSARRQLTGEQALVYVAAGRGRLLVGDEAVDLEPDTGVYLADGEAYRVDVTDDGEELVVVLVTAPQERSTPPAARRAARYREQPALPATAGREFRHLVDHQLGCHDVTQFVGVIPPSRAPIHSHTYDEVIYVVEGRGTLHVDGRTAPIEAGTCIHLPPLVEHCLENAGTASMRVLGVFHPAGDPASRAYDTADGGGRTEVGNG